MDFDRIFCLENGVRTRLWAKVVDLAAGAAARKEGLLEPKKGPWSASHPGAFGTQPCTYHQESSWVQAEDAPLLPSAFCAMATSHVFFQRHVSS